MCVCYYLVNPLVPDFPIKCPWRTLTGTLCPACGFQRSFHAFLHGRILEALSYNLYFIISIPYVILAVISTWYNVNHQFDKFYCFVYHRYTLRIYFISYFLWWVIRNVLYFTI